MNHPDSYDINLGRVSHVIDDLWFDNNKLMGKITLLNTHWGKEAQELIKDGIPFEVRPRFTGIVDSNGYVHIKKLVNQELRKLKLNKLSKYFEEQGILTESYNSRFDEPETLPTLSEDFHILKNNLHQ